MLLLQQKRIRCSFPLLLVLPSQLDGFSRVKTRRRFFRRRLMTIILRLTHAEQNLVPVPRRALRFLHVLHNHRYIRRRRRLVVVVVVLRRRRLLLQKERRSRIRARRVQMRPLVRFFSLIKPWRFKRWMILSSRRVRSVRQRWHGDGVVVRDLRESLGRVKVSKHASKNMTNFLIKLKTLLFFSLIDRFLLLLLLVLL